MPRRTIRSAGALAIASALVLLGSAPVLAHASLTGTDPEDGSTLDAAPTSLTFTFNEVVGNAAVVVSAPDGSSVDVADVRAVDREVTASVADVDQKGTYTASYRVVSADGHPISGSITYDVTTGRAVTQQAPEAQAAEQGFVHRHRTHLFWGILAVGVAVVLLLEPLRRRPDDSHDA